MMPFRSIRLPSIATLALLATACSDPTGFTPSGPVTGFDGMVTFEPDEGVSAPGATFLAPSIVTPNDTRPIPGSMFRFDPGPVRYRDPQNKGTGTLVVRYDPLALPARAAESDLRLTYWDGNDWVASDVAHVDTVTNTVRSRARPEAATYTLLTSVGVGVWVEPGERYTGYHSGDSLLVHAWTRSSEAITSITASYAGREMELTLDYSTWKGWLDVAGIPPGNHLLRATARTASGLVISDTMTIKRNVAPRVSVIHPLNFSVANPKLRVQATCADDAPEGCRSLVATLSHPDGPAMQLASGTSSIDREVSLAGGVGEMHLTITGTDVVGEPTTVRYTIHVADASNVTVRLRAPGRVLDYDGTRVLYADSVVEKNSGYLMTAGSGRVRLGTGNGSTDLVLHRGGLPDWGTILAPDHALFTVWRNRVTWRPLDWTLVYPDTDSLYEWRSGATTLLSARSYTRELQVDDGITAWQEAERRNDPPPRMSTVMMRDLAAGVTSTLSTTANSAGVDVGSGRTVVWGDWGTDPQLGSPRAVIWRDGGVRFNSEESFASGRTDGVNTVLQGYSRTDLLTPTSRTTLVGSSEEQLSAIAAHGYVAFTRPGGGTLQVWIRTPDGREQQLTNLDSNDGSVWIRDVTPSGTVIYTTGLAQYPRVLRQYAARPGQSPRYLGAGSARVVERAGQLYLLIGNTVFGVN